MKKKLKVLFCSSEVVPFAKTGGLADVSGSLPLALERLGLDVRVAMPKYKSVMRSPSPIERLTPDVSYARIGKNIPLYFIENNKYFDREGLYGGGEGDYADNLDRFVFFCKGVLALIKQIDFKPQIIHCNDWQTALIPVYIEHLLKQDPFYKDIKTIFSIHNLAYQGIFPKEEFSKTGLSKELFNIDGLEFYGKFNLMKGGLVFSTLINTVSPTYSKEIQTPEFGCGLEGVLSKRRRYLSGILNGLDYEIWDPAKDKNISSPYSLESAEKKYINKKDLQEEAGLKRRGDLPLIGVVSRLAGQKGLDLVALSMPEILGMDLQFVLLGTGDKDCQLLFEKIKKKNYKNASINITFDNRLAHKIYAGSDLFLIPSRYEPCGLGQLISLKYGTIPVVRRTGGLKDTVLDYDSSPDKGNGFAFDAPSKDELISAIKRAVAVYNRKKAWRKLVARAMQYDFSWDESAKKYITLYKKAIKA